MRDDWRLPNASRGMPFHWTGATTFVLRTDRRQPASPMTTPPIGETTGDHQPMDQDPTTSSLTGSQQDDANTPEAGNNEQAPEQPPMATEATQHPASSIGEEPEPPPSVIEQEITPSVPEHQQALYRQPETPETFQQQRARVDRQETLSFYTPSTTGRIRYGPNREVFEDRRSTTSPYSKPPAPDPETALLQATYEAHVKADVSTLPPGWRLENGYLTLEDTRDEWIFKDDKLIRRHYLPRNHCFEPTEQDAGCPLPLHYLSKDRHTLGSGNLNQYDRWKQKKNTYRQQAWTGSTIFKIMPAYRLLARQIFYNISNGHQSYKEMETAEQAYNAQQPPRPKNMKARKDQLSERNMSLEDRLAFLTAKRKELESFFQNDVWELVYDDGSIPPDRILKAHFILKLSKWPNGDPRAKARLITQGFRDPDAWSGQLSTDAPTLSRMGRNYIMSLAANTGWSTFSADVSTAFLQGKEHPSHRTLWIKLPTDAKKMLGIANQDGDKALMKLRKPMYGLCDAPRAWYSEARERVTRLGAVVHPLDPCLFMVYDYEAPEEQWLDQPDDNGNTVRQPPLLGLFGLHVDDVLGCGNMDNASFQKFVSQMKQTFTFRTWEQESDIEYCGAKIQRINQHHYELQHTNYLAKQKPISFEDTTNDTKSDQPVTKKQRTMLRGLVGALQWPATQSSPHLQASVSQLAGLTSKATTSTLREANKCLRFAKQHSDVGLKFQRIGRPEDLTLIAYSDAAFTSRHDLTSQGGQLVLLSVTTGQEGGYHLVDWRSWKLPRVARSSLAAESQAASEASDALLYAAVFWKLIWSPHLALEDSHTPKLAHSPRLIVDAKALYDLLTKQDLQTASQTDKQTSIEVLVTRDKLACTGASTSWVSSELQYADGMTKNHSSELTSSTTSNTRYMPEARPELHSLKEENTAAAKAEPDEIRHTEEDDANGNDGINGNNSHGNEHEPHQHKPHRQHERQQLHVPHPLHPGNCSSGQFDLAPPDYHLDEKQVPATTYGNTEQE